MPGPRSLLARPSLDPSAVSLPKLECLLKQLMALKKNGTKEERQIEPGTASGADVLVRLFQLLQLCHSSA